MATQISLNKILPAIDRKDRDFYDNLSDDEKKAFSGYLMLRYCSAVHAAPDVEYYYIASANHYANKYMFDLAKHPKLQWLMITAASPAVGTQRHQWLKQKPKPKNTAGDIKKQLAELYPAMKDEDLDVLASMTTKKDLREHFKKYGER